MTKQQYKHEYYLRTRGPLKGHWNSKKTHCPKGHEYTPDNTYIHVFEQTRACRTCNRERKRT